MKLIRFGNPGEERPGVLDDDDHRRDLSALFNDWNRDFFNSGGLQQLGKLLQRGIGDLPLVPEAVRWASPIARPGKVVCIGLNYSDHAAESGMAVPAEPIVFMEATSAVCGPYDDVMIPRGSGKTDWEVELGVVIREETRYGKERDGPSHVGGFCCGSDV